MAKFKSNILASASGSLNGIVFSHNRGGAYMRNRSIPINPKTERQSVVRTAMTAISTTWKSGLSDLQRAQWNIFGANTTVINTLGDPITLSGIAAFQRVNLFRIGTLGQAIQTDPPGALPAVNNIPSFAAFFVVGGVGLTWDAKLQVNGILEDFSVAMYYNQNVSAGKSYYRGPYEDLVIISGETFTDELEVLTDFADATSPRKLATKITLFHTATSVPIWTVFTSGIAVPVE
jgi:hypothetical protein